jgi:hypothetical protein
MSVEVKPKANDIMLSVDMFKKAQSEGLTFSQFLEKTDPSEAYGPNEKLDAYERQLKRFGIRVSSKPEKGIFAGKVEAFYQTAESKVLFPEFIARTARESLIADSILPELVAITTPIDSNVYTSYYVEDQPAEQTKKRVTERGELSKAVLKGKENSIKLYKYGRAIDASYEAIRRMKIDMLALHVRRIAMQAGMDKADDALGVIVNGDGNTNAATTYRLNADLGGVVATGLDFKSWLKFLLKFFPYNCNTVVGGETEIMQVLTMQFPNVDPLVLLSMIQQGPVQAKVQLAHDLFVNYRLVYLKSAPANTLTGIDKRYAIEEVDEIGSDIMESEKFILNQTSILTVSENSGFAKLFNEATKALTLNA